MPGGWITLSGNKILALARLGREWFSDLLFPYFCVGCGGEGNWLCDNCRSTIVKNDCGLCPYCRREVENFKTCPTCIGPLSGLVVSADYHNRLVRELILLLKYNFSQAAGTILSDFIKTEIIFRAFNNQSAIVIPVPLHYRRLAWRGFNQSDVIGRSLAEFLTIEFNNKLLKRTVNTKPQAELDEKSRQENVRGIFKTTIEIDSIDRRRRLILVDDVYTTGATINECAKVLRDNGFTDVWGFVLARKM